MGLGYLGLQLISIPVSAVTGAVVLLWLQTKYRRVKLLQGLQQEILDNIHAVGMNGIHISENDNIYKIRRSTFSDDIFRVTRSQTPILYTQLVEGLSPVSRAYIGIAHLRNLDQLDPSDDARENLLEFLEELEDELIEAGERVEDIQKESYIFRIYSHLYLKKIHRGRYTNLVSTEEGIEEKVWRPSGKTTNEKREEIK